MYNNIILGLFQLVRVVISNEVKKFVRKRHFNLQHVKRVGLYIIFNL